MGEVDPLELNEREIVKVFKALADENRILILKLLRGGEKCACKLLEELQISQPTLSHHMKILCDSGIVTGRKEGKWMHYSICAEGAENAQRYLTALAAPLNTEKKPCCEK